MTNPTPPPVPQKSRALPGEARASAGIRQHGATEQQRRQAKRPAPPEPESSFAWLFYSLVGLGALLAAAVSFLFVAQPAELLRNEIVAQVKAKTGRDLIIGGPMSLKLLPTLSLTMVDVTMSAPPGMTAPPVVAMKSLVVNVELWPLLRREVAVKRLVLEEPLLDLRIDKSGRRSWQLADSESTASPRWRYAQLAQHATDTPGLPAVAKDFVQHSTDPERKADRRRSRVSQLALGDVRIRNGTLRYLDERDGTGHDVSGLDVAFKLDGFSQPFALSGGVTYRGERITFESRLSDALSLLDGGPTGLIASIKSEPATLSYDGKLVLNDKVELAGALTAQALSARRLASWLGLRPPPSDGLGRASIAGYVRIEGGTVSLSQAKISLDGATATGSLSVEPLSPRPLVTADLKLNELDLNKYASAENGERQRAPGTTGLSAATPDAAPPSTSGTHSLQSIGDILKREGQQVNGDTRRAGWSDETIRLWALGFVDVDARLDLDRLVYKDISAGRTRLSVALRDRKLATDMEDMQLYDGHAKGRLTIDATNDAATVGLTISADNVAAQRLLNDAADLGWLSGRTRLALALTGQGTSERQIVETLRGTAELAVTDGAISGFNLAKILRGLSDGHVSGLKNEPSEKTDFSDLTATFAIRDGVAENQDLRLTSPLLRLTGAGKVLLPARELDYTLRPKLVASLAGQGGAHDIDGIEVPVRLTGPWAKPAITPDLDGLLKDPSKTVEKIKEIGKQLKGKSADEIVRGLLGKNAGEDGKKVKAKDLLKQFLQQ